MKNINYMNKENINKTDYLVIEEMKIAGIKIRTTNKDGQSIKDQSEFWRYFFQNGISEKITNKLFPEELLGIYYNYESDYTGYYDFLIGYEVSEFDNLPEGLEKITLQSDKYIVFNNRDKLSIDNKIGKIWQEVWVSGIDRKYNFDIEEYDVNTLFSENPEINIYIGIK